MRIHITTAQGELVDTLDIDNTWDIDSPIHLNSIKDWVDEALHRAKRMEAQS
jgi:hypothetical protein